MELKGFAKPIVFCLAVLVLYLQYKFLAQLGLYFESLKKAQKQGKNVVKVVENFKKCSNEIKIIM